MDDSASSLDHPSRLGLGLNRASTPPWITVEMPSPPCRGKDQNSGGERTAETGRPLGKIDVFQVQPLALNLLDRGGLSFSSQRNNDQKTQHEHTLQCLAQRLGRVVSSRWVNQEQQKTLKILQDKERRLVESQDLAKIGQWELDLTNNALYWSHGVFDIFRVDPKRFGASYEAFLDAIHPDDRKFVDDAYTNSLKSKKSYNIMHRLLFQGDGEEPEIRWVNEICRTEYHPKTGLPLYSVGIVQDITELKQAQEMDRLKTAFLANMSHEIRTPLNAVMGYTDLILMEPEALSERNRDYLKTIRQSGELLMAVVSDILDISKIEAGQLQIDDKPYSPSELLALVGQSASVFQENFMPGKKVKLDFTNNSTSQLMDVSCASQQTLLDHSSGGNSICQTAQVMGDPARIQQILLNIVNNALKFTGIQGSSNGKVEFGVKLVQGKGGSSSGKMMEFSVSDNGVGIPEEKQQSIFEAFTQVHPSRDSHELGGTGLGLTISKRLVELMGGEMQLWSSTHTIHHGTTVSFTLPYRPVNEATSCQLLKHDKCTIQSPPSHANAEEQLRQSLTTTSTATESEAKPPASGTTTSNDTTKESSASSTSAPVGKVLVVDDNRVNLKLAVRMVNKLGYETEMPVMDGLEAVQEIRKIERVVASSEASTGNRRIPVVALTAAAYREDEEACLAAGCDAYLTKPVKREALQNMLASYLKDG
ncbi:Sensor protein kinase WalK (Fragment) [Seminavis robusta]|uniref:histidine kinase n=1 Tax=Seminavis robusta TaxID=568900 RepID=A0A9N8DJJ2_9STRA